MVRPEKDVLMTPGIKRLGVHWDLRCFPLNRHSLGFRVVARRGSPPRAYRATAKSRTGYAAVCRWSMTEKGQFLPLGTRRLTRRLGLRVKPETRRIRRTKRGL